MKSMCRLFACLLFLIVMLACAVPGFAQGCTVTSTSTTSGTAATACFVKAGNQVNMQLTGTWAGTVDVQVSRDGGVTYVKDRSFTANVATTSTPLTYDARIRFFITTRTSGTISYSMTDKTVHLGLIKYESVPIGSVAYASMGTSVVGISTSEAVVSVFVEDTMNATGLAVLVGATGGTDTMILSLYDNTGSLVATTDTAGTTVSASANAFQEIAFTVPPTLKRGRYYITMQVSGTTATTRRIAASTYVSAATGSITSVFGTVPTAISPPTTFTALYGLFAYIY